MKGSRLRCNVEISLGQDVFAPAIQEGTLHALLAVAALRRHCSAPVTRPGSWVFHAVRGSLASKLRMIGLKPAGAHPLPLSRASSSEGSQFSRPKFSKRLNMYRKQPIARDRIRFIQFFPRIPENCPGFGPGVSVHERLLSLPRS